MLTSINTFILCGILVYNNDDAPFQPHTWLRYIDDIFMIWTEGLDNLNFHRLS